MDDDQRVVINADVHVVVGSGRTPLTVTRGGGEPQVDNFVPKIAVFSENAFDSSNLLHQDNMNNTTRLGKKGEIHFSLFFI